ncbi:MAG: isoprenyl transferase [Verrucomicrobiota bacterium]
MTPDSQLNPRHVAIVMDGNGRWARQRNLSRTAGHSKGVENVQNVLKAAQKCEVEHLTLFAFSSENWNRPESEVEFLMGMFLEYLQEQSEELLKNEIRFETIGDISALSANLQGEINRVKAETAQFTKHQLNLAVNYGSRNEIVAAVKAFAQDVAEGKAAAQGLNWERFENYLSTSHIPDPDLVIRTSGEYRLSNFLLMQSAYSEFFFSKVFWPDFGEEAFMEAIEHYRSRERRFGKTSEQVTTR